MRKRVRGVVVVILVLGMARPVTAGGTAVVIDWVERSGSTLTVSGRSTYVNEPPVMLGTDPAGDALVPGLEHTGKDLVGFSLSSIPGGGVTFRWHLDALAPAVERGSDVAYGKAFCIEPSATPDCWVVLFVDLTGAQNSSVQGWRCADASCAVRSGNWVHTWGTDFYDAAAKIAGATIPPRDLGIEPGSRLVSVDPAGWEGSVFVTTPWWFLSVGGVYPTWDGTAILGEYELPSKRVSIGVGGAEDAVFSTQVSPDAGGRWATDLDVSGLSGEHTVHARACFGVGNCGYASTVVTL